jgi:hypothetical protein
MSSALDLFVLFVSFMVKPLCTSARGTSFSSRPFVTLTHYAVSRFRKRCSVTYRTFSYTLETARSPFSTACLQVQLLFSSILPLRTQRSLRQSINVPIPFSAYSAPACAAKADRFSAIKASVAQGEEVRATVLRDLVIYPAIARSFNLSMIQSLNDSIYQ